MDISELNRFLIRIDLFLSCDPNVLYTWQGLKLTTPRRPGDVINCHREDQYSLSGRPRDEENFVGTDFKFSTFSANPNGFAVGGKDFCEM